MKTLPLHGLLCSGLLLMLMSCGETPTSFDPGDSNPDGAHNDARISLNAPQQALAHARATPIVIHVPRQIVDALRDGQPTRAQVQASIRIGSDGTAAGTLRWRTREDGRVIIRALTARGIFDADGAFVRAELVFIEANGELVTATVMPSPTDPACQIWNLMNEDTGERGQNDFPERVSFEASGAIRVRDGSR